MKSITHVKPDGWTVLEITMESDTHYRVFATWRDDSLWRLSSGSTSIDDIFVDSGNLVWPQHSGKNYYLPPEGAGCYTFNQGRQLEAIEAKIARAGATVKRFDLKLLLAQHGLHWKYIE